MEDQSSHPIPPELKAMVDAEISVEGLESPIDQQRLRSLLENLPGVESVCFRERKIAIRHDAESTTNSELCRVLAQSGFKPSDVETASTIPTVSAS